MLLTLYSTSKSNARGVAVQRRPVPAPEFAATKPQTYLLKQSSVDMSNAKHFFIATHRWPGLAGARKAHVAFVSKKCPLPCHTRFTLMCRTCATGAGYLLLACKVSQGRTALLCSLSFWLPDILIYTCLVEASGETWVRHQTLRQAGTVLDRDAACVYAHVSHQARHGPYIRLPA